MAQNIEQAFRQLGGTEKTQFINKKIDYASERAVADYVEQYALGVARYLSEGTLVAMLQTKNNHNKTNETASD